MKNITITQNTTNKAVVTFVDSNDSNKSVLLNLNGGRVQATTTMIGLPALTFYGVKGYITVAIQDMATKADGLGVAVPAGYTQAQAFTDATTLLVASTTKPV